MFTLKTAFIASLLILAPDGYQSQMIGNEPCDTADVDTEILAENEIFPTNLVKPTLNASTDWDIMTKIDAVIQMKGLKVFQVTTDELMNPGKEPDKLGDLGEIESEYHDVCPTRWYRLYYWRWFFFYPGKYCWAINDLWLTKCTCNFCKMRPNLYEYLYYNLRCAPEKRLSVFLAVCYDTDSREWSKAYLRRHLPKGCVCRNYWRFPMAKQCLITTADEDCE